MEMVPGAVAGRNARVLGWIFLGDICEDRYVMACRSMLERYVWERTYMRTQLDGSLRSMSDGPEVWCARLVGRVTGQRPRVP